MAIGTTESVRVAYGSALSAAVDAGVVAIKKSVDRKYTVVDVWMRSTGSMDTCTSVDVTDGTTVFSSFEDAALTNLAIKRIGCANSAATNLGTAAAANTNIKVMTAGAGIGTATAVEWCILYTVESVT